MAPPTKIELARGVTKNALVDRLLESGYKKCKYTRSQLAALKRDDLIALVHKRDLEELAGLPRTTPLKKRSCAAGTKRAASTPATGTKAAKKSKGAAPRASYPKPRNGDKVVRFRIERTATGARGTLDAVAEPYVVGDFFTTSGGQRYIKTAGGTWDYVSAADHERQQQAYLQAVELAKS